MGFRVTEYQVSICTQCWNDSFDFNCSNCKRVNVGTQMCYVKAPVVYATFNSLREYSEQLREFKEEYYKIYTDVQITQ